MTHQKSQQKAAEQPEKATFMVTSVTVTSEDEVKPDPLAGLTDDEVRAYWMEKSLARFKRRTAHLHRPQDVSLSNAKIVPASEIERDPEIESAIHLRPPEDTKAILRILHERKLARLAASADSADKQ